MSRKRDTSMYDAYIDPFNDAQGVRRQKANQLWDKANGARDGAWRMLLASAAITMVVLYSKSGPSIGDVVIIVLVMGITITFALQACWYTRQANREALRANAQA